MGAPPIAVERAWDSQDEGRAVTRQQSAGRPQDGLVLEEGDDELDQGAGRQASQDLRDREPEAEDGLA